MEFHYVRFLLFLLRLCVLKNSYLCSSFLVCPFAVASLTERTTSDPLPSHASSCGAGHQIRKLLQRADQTMQKCCEAFRNLSGQPNMLYLFTLMNANICIEARRWYGSEKVLFKSQFCFLLWTSCISICGLKLHCNSNRSLLTKPSSSLVCKS